jgi:hypothetical protein
MTLGVFHDHDFQTSIESFHVRVVCARAISDMGQDKMTISSNRKDLFRYSSIGDKLNLFQLLFETKGLTSDLTLALLKIIHDELNNHQKPDRTVFRRYAEMVASLRYHVPEMFQQVLDDWKAHQGAEPAEWFDEEKASG